MKNKDESLLRQTLFNAQVRPQTRGQVLISALDDLGIDPQAFFAALEKSSSDPENVPADQRERERFGLKEPGDIVKRELAMMKL